MIVNRIKFPEMPLAEDIITNFSCLCFAKKILRVPNINYIYTQRPDSVSHVDADFEKSFRKWIKSLNSGFNKLSKIMNKFPLKVIQQGRQVSAAYSQIHPAALNQFVEKEFHPDDAAFSAYLFNTLNIYQQ